MAVVDETPLVVGALPVELAIVAVELAAAAAAAAATAVAVATAEGGMGAPDDMPIMLKMWCKAGGCTMDCCTNSREIVAHHVQTMQRQAYLPHETAQQGSQLRISDRGNRWRSIQSLCLVAIHEYDTGASPAHATSQESRSEESHKRSHTTQTRLLGTARRRGVHRQSHDEAPDQVFSLLIGKPWRPDDS